jgi:CheY-like chemotaxis protein
VSTVLIAEDDPDICAVMKLILGKAGHRILTAGTGPVALDMVRRWRPDLLVLDLSLPGMTGMEVCRAVRADPATAATTILDRVGECVRRQCRRRPGRGRG